MLVIIQMILRKKLNRRNQNSMFNLYLSRKSHMIFLKYPKQSKYKQSHQQAQKNPRMTNQSVGYSIGGVKRSLAKSIFNVKI